MHNKMIIEAKKEQSSKINISEKRYKNLKEINISNLIEIIFDNKDTEFGMLHKFCQINDYDEYKDIVPISDYNNYKEYVERMQKGDKNILTAYDIVTYCKTSGTTNKQKIIPLTDKALEKYGNDTINANISKVINEYRNEHGNGHRLFIHTICQEKEGTLSKCDLISEVLYLNLYKNGKMNPEELSGGLELFFDSQTEDVFYPKLWVAILDPDIIVIDTMFSYEIIRFFAYFENNYKQIISDILKGIIPEEKIISAKIRNKLLSIPVDKDRLEFVKNECDKGFDEIAKRIWPNIQRISCCISKRSIMELNSLDKYCKGISIDCFVFVMSECFIGISSGPDRFDYAFKTSNAFYELLEYSDEDKKSCNVVLLSDAKIGQLYEPIITTYSGFYRYRTGDIIKIVGEYEGIPTFEFQFRKNVKINIAEERMTELQLEEVMKKIKEIIPNIKLYSFSANFWNGIGTYFLFLCVDKKDTDVNINFVENFLDEALSEINSYYKLSRDEQSLGKPKIYVLNYDDYIKLVSIGTPKKKHEKAISIIPRERLNFILREGLVKK